MKTIRIGMFLMAVAIVSLIAGITIYFYTQFTRDLLSILGDQKTLSPTTQSIDLFFENVKKVEELGGFEKMIIPFE